MTKPTDVRIVRADGTEISCELVHQGVDSEGIDNWAICGVQFNPPGDHLKVGVLPARTSIVIDTNTSQLPKDFDFTTVFKEGEQK